MQCSNCKSQNPQGKKFCLQCGAALSARCNTCGSENPPDSRFCGDCGAALDAGPAQSSQAASAVPSVRITGEEPSAAPPDGERKTVTALFADIKGSMELMEDLNPEEARAIVDPVLLMIKDLSKVAEAERCLRTAIDVARRQAARLYELRATVSLSRLLKRQGKIDEARAMLSDIYNWFTEGFDTADLKDAKALLDELQA